MKRLLAHRLFDGEQFYHNVVLTIAEQKIVDIEQNSAQFDEVLSGLVVPGFIDVQVNGGGGVLFNDSPTLNTLSTMLSAHCQYGTTAFLPTLITDELSVMQQAAETISVAIQQNQPGILGVHFEGPHLSIPKKGAHSEHLIRDASPLEWQLFTRGDLGKVVVTLAPETVDITAISTLLSAKVLVSIGHSNADFETAQAAVDIGVNGFTHIFNAMSGLQGRQPGVLGCALLNDQCYAGIILDGHHVDFASARLAYKVKPDGKLFLVTDAMSTIGTEQTVFDFFDRQVKLEDGKLLSTTGELAGSALTMIDAVKNAMNYLHLSAAEALRMASTFPAHYLGVADSYGYLRPGYYASFVVLTDDFKVQQTWIKGQPCFIRTLKNDN